MGEELQDIQEESLIVDGEGAAEEEVQAGDTDEPETEEVEGEGEQPEDENSEDVPIEQKYEGLSRNYQRLERKFTKVSQENAQLKQVLAEAQRAIDFYNAVALNPELAANVNQLLDIYGASIPVQDQVAPDFDPASERQVMRELLSRPDFVKHEEEIAEWAEDNGIPFETTAQQKVAYLLWKGENADRLIQAAKMEAVRKAAKVQQAKQKAGLQRSGGSGKPPKPDFRRMSDEEVLATMGLSLYTDE